MSKKQRRLKRRIRHNERKAFKAHFKFDVHHICWQRRKWGHGYAKKLREHWWLKVTIPTETLHHRIHEEIVSIPVPRESICRETYEAIVELEKRGSLKHEQSFETRLQLLICLLDCVEPLTADALKKQLSIVEEFYARPP